jgi:hypothetical protein
MSLLTPEELEKLQGAESLFPSPIPVQSLSSDEFMPSPQTPKQREFEGRVKDIGAKLAKKHGMSRRKFFNPPGAPSSRTTRSPATSASTTRRTATAATAPMATC